MFQAHLPIEFWGECVRTAVYLINRTPNKLLGGKSPFEILNHKAPDLSHLKIFGCLCFVHLKTSNKFSPRSTKCMFVGYPSGTKGWRVYDLDSHRFFHTRDIAFDESHFPFAPITRRPNLPPPLKWDPTPIKLFSNSSSFSPLLISASFYFLPTFSNG